MEEKRNKKRPIFRAEAVQRYLQSQQESVFPRFASPNVFLCLWILIGLFIVSLGFAWLAQIPIYASGQAIVTTVDSLPNTYVLAIFLSPQHHSQLQDGQSIFIQSEAKENLIQQKITAIMPYVISPQMASDIYGLPSGIVTEPTVVALAQFDPSTMSSFPTSTYIGSRYPVQVEIGSRRLISLLPFIQ